MAKGTRASHGITVVALCVTWALAGFSSATASPLSPGTFSDPFSEPTVDGRSTKDKCVEHTEGEETHKECKPAAGSMSVLADGRVLYWNALEGTENIKNGIALEFGTVSINDQTRILDLSGPTWTEPKPVDAGANPQGKHPDELFPDSASTETYNDGALFCADVVQLPDGRILAIGGTQYYTEGGAVELEGLPNSRIFDPEKNRWTQTGSMNYGRWYPSAVTLANGDVFVASGVKKLIKPIYPSQPTESGRNVLQTETYDVDTGRWTYNGAGGDRSLPLYPRLHLLPNGKVFYNSGGQVFNPSGQSYDEATWNIAAAYDPPTKTWSNLGVPGLGTKAPGFRGSTFSIMLPLRPNAQGVYDRAEFLSAGGIYGVTPGTYLAHPFSTITTVTTSDMMMSSRDTGMLNHNRWYSTGVLLPDGEVFAVSGASSDEVVGPGTGMPVTEAEIFDPETEQWRTVASQHHARTYHNTAMLLPDGSVLVGGHAPIPTLYGFHQTLPGSLFSPNEGRDPTFEIYKPWYFERDDRPEVVNVSEQIGYGRTFNVVVDGKSSDIEGVLLVRNPSITHLIDGDQRNVELRIIKRAGHMLTVAGPPKGAVAPPGPYLLFVNKRAADGALVPSTGEQVFI